MTNGNDRLDRIERILEESARQHQEFSKEHEASISRIDKRLEYMAARQQYHDEAFERFDADMKVLKEAQMRDADHIHALVRIAELHNRRLEGLEGGEVA